ncbi:MAG: sigma-70 family RNA polymerase sigma factor [Deltaproteobacteria bacterium]
MKAMQNTSGDLFPKFSMKEEHLSRLVSEIAAGSESALRAFYEITSPLVYGVALRILGNAAEAEEITADVYMQVWTKARQYDWRRSSPLAWLMMITRSRAIDRIRSGAQRRKFEDSAEIEYPDTSESAEDSTLRDERYRKIQDAFSRLDPRQRQALNLAYFRGLSQSEIAIEMNQPIGTVKSWMRFGMIKLRGILTNED